MNNISNSPVYAAMEGQTTPKIQVSNSKNPQKVVEPLSPSGAQVAQDIVENIAEIKEDTKHIEKMSELINGTRVQFNLSKELNEVIVKIVDPNTNQVLRELPSKEIQNLKLRIRKAIGTIFDEFV